MVNMDGNAILGGVGSHKLSVKDTQKSHQRIVPNLQKLQSQQLLKMATLHTDTKTDINSTELEFLKSVYEELAREVAQQKDTMGV